MTERDSTLQRAYDPEAFRIEAHRLVDLLADHLAAAARGEGPVMPWVPPAQQAAAWELALHEAAPPFAVWQRYLAAANHLHHPRYMGHQVPPPLPIGALSDLVVALLNNSGAVYEMGPAASAIETVVVRWMTRVLGLGEAAGGLLASGGSLGNLRALVAAREVARGDAPDHGGGERLALLVNEEAHYSVARAAQVMGLGEGGVIQVPTDDQHRMRPELLGDLFERATAGRRKVLAVVANAGSTATGAYDPLPAIADFCEERKLWLHVDGAHGAAAALSAAHRHLVYGIGRADSVIWDAHKLLLQPSLITGVLFRRAADARRTFAQEASYLLGPSAEEEWYNFSHLTLECTKNAMGLKLFATLSAFGEELLGDYVDRVFGLARNLAAQIEASDDFKLAVEPPCNIVCFRYAPGGEPAADDVQERIRERVCRDGGFYLVKTRLRERVHLRVTLMNPLTTEEDLAALLQALRAAAASST
jgi:L-2,4-diaminobutyrate decarboxylase